MTIIFGRTQDSLGTPFEPLRNPAFGGGVSIITAQDAQSAIEEVSFTSQVSASPSFSWGRTGAIPAGSWLLNDSVPSNRAGRTLMINNGKMSKISVATETLDTYQLEIYEHSGNQIGLTLLHTVTITATRSAQISIPNISVTSGKQVAVLLSTGAAKNLVVGMIIKGST